MNSCGSLFLPPKMTDNRNEPKSNYCKITQTHNRTRYDLCKNNYIFNNGNSNFRVIIWLILLPCSVLGENIHRLPSNGRTQKVIYKNQPKVHLSGAHLLLKSHRGEIATLCDLSQPRIYMESLKTLFYNNFVTCCRRSVPDWFQVPSSKPELELNVRTSSVQT